ncbi:pre-16S rRNA-processing nuclease YqgF [Lyngbya sp. PCC 8106]|uniref:pre-16S rRNA-processing nuclease YqgF n=1 Tax=Lyngbya sp. (strain PCC 8106) TaxID=313612 RepID=UPI00067FF9CA|nr:pre-16S rRNA-processing nuclease YqgF [Lyngbya sp. PCC 8106]
MILGFDPGKDKCGIAVMENNNQLQYHQVIPSTEAIKTLQSLCQQFPIHLCVMGNQTTSKSWKQKLSEALPNTLQIILVDERYSSLEARDRYWQMYPPQGLTRLIPQGMRTPPRPIDDLVAIILIERYLSQKLN